MSDDIRHHVGGLFGDRLAVKVSADVLPDEHDDHSFQTVTERADEDGGVTLTLDAGMTRLNVHGVDAAFDGYKYFPRDPETVDYDVRGDVGDAKVKFEGVTHLSATHPARNMTVDKLIRGLESGDIQPLPKHG